MKKKSLPAWILNVLLVLVIYSTNEMGRLLGLTEYPLAISVIWPATGFSLAALLLWGTPVSFGIFSGNFIYNMSHLYLSTSLFSSFFAASFISVGSLLEALVGFYIIRRYSSSLYLETIRDMVIFLLFGGILTCLIAATIGSTVLAIYEQVFSFSTISQIWTTFWIGDVMGIYIFTPLIIAWTMIKPKVSLERYMGEAIFICLALCAMGFLVLYWNYPLTPLYVPLIAWIAYRFRLHGGTLAILFIGIPLIAAYALGFEALRLFYLVIFLEVLVSINLLITGIANELESAWKIIQQHTKGLQTAFDFQEKELKLFESEIFIKDKLNAVSLMNARIAQYIQFPLNQMNAFIQRMDEVVQNLFEDFDGSKGPIESATALVDQKKYALLKDTLANISKYQSQSYNIAKAIEEQSYLASPGNIAIKRENINEILHHAFIASQKNAFHFETEESYPVPADLVLVFPEDLSQALTTLINRSIYSMKVKREFLKEEYSPQLQLKTEVDADKIQILIKDNGMGVSSAQLLNFFQPFISVEETGLGLYMANEIIRNLFQGVIQVDSKEKEYLQFRVILPKPVE